MWSICLPQSVFAFSWNMLRGDLWHFHIHKLKGSISLPQCPFTSVSFSVLLPFHRSRLKGALKVIFMAHSQVQKANVKTEANCWKRSLLLSSAEPGDRYHISEKKKAMGKISPLHPQCHILGRLQTNLGSNERYYLLWLEQAFFFFFLRENRIKIGGTGRHTCLIEGKYASCWNLGLHF